MSEGADDDPRATAHDAQGGATNRQGDGEQEGWGGDRDDPRLFYFRALLDNDRFFGGLGRA